MDIRVLRYFLVVAQEGNITKAAEALHITQPTLSRQLMDLEQELGTELLIRGRRQLTLTDSGILFQQRAREIVALLEKTGRDLAEQQNLVGGVVSIGCVETVASHMLPEALREFTANHPMVQYELYNADGDDIREKLDRGDIDIGVLIEPVEAAKYDYIRLPHQEVWGVLMRSDDPLADREALCVEDILSLPLLVPRRRIVQEEIAGWLGVECAQLRIVASHNLLTNVTLLVAQGLGYAIVVQGAYTIRPTEGLRFVPFSPQRLSGHVVAWKKNRVFSSATARFIAYVKNKYHT